jgi:hypothetical protein
MNDMENSARNVELSDAGGDGCADEWTTPWVVATLRRIALFLLLAALAEVIVWYGNLRLYGSSEGTATNIFVATFGVALLLAVATAVLAFVLDLLMYVRHSTRIALALETSDA